MILSLMLRAIESVSCNFYSLNKDFILTWELYSSKCFSYLLSQLNLSSAPYRQIKQVNWKSFLVKAKVVMLSELISSQPTSFQLHIMPCLLTVFNCFAFWQSLRPCNNWDMIYYLVFIIANIMKFLQCLSQTFLYLVVLEVSVGGNPKALTWNTWSSNQPEKTSHKSLSFVQFSCLFKGQNYGTQSNNARLSSQSQSTNYRNCQSHWAT